MDFFQNNSTLTSIITLCSASVLCPLQPFWPPCPDLGDKRQLPLCRRGQARLVWLSPGQDRATRARRAEHAHSHSPLSTQPSAVTGVRAGSSFGFISLLSLTFQSQPVAATGADSNLHPNWRLEPELSAGTSRCKKSNQSSDCCKRARTVFWDDSVLILDITKQRLSESQHKLSAARVPKSGHRSGICA